MSTLTAENAPSFKPSSLDDAVPSLSGMSSRHSAEQVVIRLPKVYDNWPWPCTLNLHYQEARQESNTWMRNFRCLSEKRQAKFEACNFSLAAALLWPKLDKGYPCLSLRPDLTNLYFMFDHFSDIRDGEEVQKQADIMKDALKDLYKPRPHGDAILGEITRQDGGHVRSIQEYLSVRRLTITVRPSLALFEVLDAQDNGPMLESLMLAVTDIILLDNACK
ncbi:hypothetical protein AX16_005083 [Volvariella volvacea WC 439]|nr:hypothetical protein AX16_005083 [Volvariella volvacea WC 439]